MVQAEVCCRIQSAILICGSCRTLYNLKEKFYPLWISCISEVTYQLSNDFCMLIQKELPEQASF